MRQFMGGTLAETAIVLMLGVAVGGCSAEDPMLGGRAGAGMFPVGGAGGQTATAGGPGGGLAGGSGTNSFGNPTGPAKMIGDGTMKGNSCLEPTVWFVIDGSGSMCDTFGGGTRWTELRKTLLDPMNGLIYRFQQQVDFRVVLYDGNIDFAALAMATGGTPSPMCAGGGGLGRMGGDQCPQLRKSPSGRNMASAIDGMYPQMELGGSTPTDRAMNMTVDELIAANPGANAMLHPKFIILATDGQPNDICTGGMGGDGAAQQAAVVSAVEKAYGAGIRTYVISLANGDPGLEQHLTMVAQRGDQMNPMAKTYSPASPDALLADMKTLLGNALGCAVQ